MKGRLASVVVLLVLLSTAGSVHAATWYVSKDSPGPIHDGTSWETALSVIQEAITLASDGDTIIVAPGVYYEHLVFPRESLTLTSTNPLDPAVVDSTIIDGGGGGILADFQDRFPDTYFPEYLLTGFTLRNGCKGVFTYNQNSPTITHCVFRDINSYDCGYYPAAIAFNWGTVARIEDCIFTGNHMAFSNINWSNPVVRNSLVYGNGTVGYFGGYFGRPVFDNCTIADNGSGFGFDNNSSPDHYLTLRNSILWNVTPAYGNSTTPDFLRVSYSTVMGGWAGFGNLASDPRFVDPASGDYRLLPDSPCIDTGNNDYASATDQDLDGNPRIVNALGGPAAVVDMGSYESADLVAPAVTISEPTSDPAYFTRYTTVSLGGTASDNNAVASVLWSNNRGGNGVASIVGSVWSVSGVSLQAGVNLVTVTAADLSGHHSSASIAITLDVAPPAVVSTVPAPGATNVLRGETSTLFFNENILPGANYAGISITYPQGKKTVAYTTFTKDYSGNVLRLIPDPATPLPSSVKVTVTLPAGSITDSAGNPTSTSHGWSFTTGKKVN